MWKDGEGGKAKMKDDATTYGGMEWWP